MAGSLTHAYVSAVADAGNPDEVGPNEWNAAHVQDAAGLIGKSSAGASEVLTPAEVRALIEVPALQDIYLWDEGVRPDDSTDMAAIANPIIDDLNTAGTGRVNIVVPAGGIVRSGALNAITAPYVNFVSESGGMAFIRPTAATWATWGTSGTVVTGGGAKGIGILGGGTLDDVVFYSQNHAKGLFDDIFVTGVSQLWRGGESGVSNAATILFDRLRGNCANVANKLFRLSKGAGFFLNNFQISVVLAGGAGTQASGRCLVGADEDSWDTTVIGQGLAEQFERGIDFHAVAGKVIHGLWTGAKTVFDACKEGDRFRNTSTGVVSNLHINGWRSVTDGHGLELNGDNVFGAEINIRLTNAAKHGIYLNTAKKVKIGALTELCDMNSLASTWDGIHANAVTDLSIIGAMSGLTDAAYGVSNQPRYGVNVVGCENFLVAGVAAEGSSSRMNFDLTGSSVYRVAANLGVADFASHTAGSALTLTGTILAGTTSLSGGQLAFPASQSASADANTLDDYEEGTWTPALTIATPGDLSVTQAVSGVYTKVGDTVDAWYSIATSVWTWTTSSGNINTTGWPFTAKNITPNFGNFRGLARYGGWTKANYTQINTSLPVNTAVGTFAATGSGQAASILVAADAPSGTQQSISGYIAYKV